MVGYPHWIKGEGIYAYVTLMSHATPSEALQEELLDLVRKEIGAIAKPDVIQWAPGLPKTRSGKIMRRILRKIAASELENLGDTTTLAVLLWCRIWSRTANGERRGRNLPSTCALGVPKVSRSLSEPSARRLLRYFLHAQFDASALVDVQHDHVHLLSFLQVVGHLLDALIGDCRCEPGHPCRAGC